MSRAIPKSADHAAPDAPEGHAWMVNDAVGVPVLLPLAWLDRGDYRLASAGPDSPPDPAGETTTTATTSPEE